MLISDTSPSGFRVQLLGTLSVTVQGKSVLRLGSKAGNRLFAFLAVHRNLPADRVFLATMLWPESSQAMAMDHLRHCLVKLKSALGSEAGRLIAPDKKSLRLNLAGADVDLDLFERRASESTLDEVIAGLQMYAGPLLKDLDDEWCVVERNRVQAIFDMAIERLALLAEREQRVPELLAPLRRAHAADGNSETIARALMAAYAATGDYAAAILVYEKLRARLRAAFGGPPEAETIERVKEIKRRAQQDTDAAQVSDPNDFDRNVVIDQKGGIPALSGALIGRENALIEVQALLEGGARGRLITLVGPGGIGKTQLSIAASHAVRTDFPDGAFFVDLSAIRRSDEGALLVEVLSVLGVNPGGAPAEEALVGFLGQRRILLILDNCEQIARACGDLASGALAACRNLRVLATSRVALKVNCESVFRVSALTLPKARPTDRFADVRRESPRLGALSVGGAAFPRLSRYSAVALFVTRATEARRSFSLSAANAESVVSICRLLDGIPLAIELAAAWVRSLSTDQIHAQLQAHIGLLKTRSGHSSARHSTLASALEWSYELLPRAERRLWLGLSLFPDGGSLDAVRAVCLPDDTEQTVIEELTTLVDSSVVVFTEQGFEGRYHLPEAMRSYGLSHPDWVDADLLQIRARFVQYFLQKAEEAAPHLQGEDQAEWVGLLDMERANLRQAIAYAADRKTADEAGLRIAAAIWRYYHIRGFYADGYLSLVGIVESAPIEATVLKATAEIGVGNLAYQSGNVAAARRHYQSALQIGREVESVSCMARALGSLSLICNSEKDYVGSRVLLEECRELFLQCKDYRGLSVALQNLAVTAVHQQDFDSAYRYHKESIQLVRDTTGDAQVLGTSLANLASLYLTNDAFESARPLLIEALSITRELRSTLILAHCLLISLRMTLFYGWLETAAMVIGADAVLRQQYHAPLTGDVLVEQSKRVAVVEAGLEPAVYCRLCERGAAMTQDELTDYLLELFREQ